MTARDWTSPEGRAELRWLLARPGGWVAGTLRVDVGRPDVSAALEATWEAVIPLLDVLEAAERERNEAQAREAKLREALAAHVAYFGGASHHRLGRQVHDALALPVGRSALDAMLAEARREGARACVEAASKATDEMREEAGFHWTGAVHVLAAVKRITEVQP